MTNSLSAFSLLEAREDCELCLVGGMYRRRTAAFVGPTAEDRVAIEEHTQVICWLALQAILLPSAGAGVPLYNDAKITLGNKDEAILRYD